MKNVQYAISYSADRVNFMPEQDPRKVCVCVREGEIEKN